MTAPARMSSASRDPRVAEMPEYRIQAAIVEHLRATIGNRKLHASPNGAHHNDKQGAKLRWTGTLNGWPDLEVLSPGGRVHFIEVKTLTGRLQPAQVEMRDWCEANDVPWALVRSLDEALASAKAWGLL